MRRYGKLAAIAMIAATCTGCLAATDPDLVQAYIRDWIAFAAEIVALLPT